MNSDTEIKLNIGAGKTYIPGFTNIDITDSADLKIDLSKEELPFKDSSVDLIFTYHTLEHVDNYLFSISEIHRVLKHGGRLLVGVPYVTSTEYNLVNPYHKNHFNEFSFDFFDPTRMKGTAEEDNDILFRVGWHRFNYFREFVNKPAEKQKWLRRHYFNVVKKIDFGMFAIKGTENLPVVTSPETESMFEKVFDDCMSARTKY